MSFPFKPLGGSSTRPRIQLSHVPPTPPPLDEYDENASEDCEPDARSSTSSSRLHPNHLSARSPYHSSAPPSPDLSAQSAHRPSSHALIYSQGGSYGGGYTHSPYSTASNTPLPSRSPSPVPLYFSGASSCSSESDSELDDGHYAGSALSSSRSSSWREERRRWWIMGAVRRRRRRERIGGWRAMKRGFRLLIRHPFFPKTPVTILLTLVLLTIFGVSLTFLIIYILNPDKEPLPWRGYCAIPQYSTRPPSLELPTTAQFPDALPKNFTPLAFPPPDLDDYSPAGVFVGVFSMDNAVERRMLIRSSWANHQRSRDGAGEGDGGVGTSRTVVRFILGEPRSEWKRRIRLEMDMYNDMIILPIPENMNNGKTYAYFSWAASNAWVPPLYYDNFAHVPKGLSYANTTAWFSTVPATHDPLPARQDYAGGNPMKWVRPDYIVKTDDDSFVMLAELEARLRVELHKDPQEVRQQNGAFASDVESSVDSSSSPAAFVVSGSDSRPGSSGTSASEAPHALVTPTSTYYPPQPAPPVNNPTAPSSDMDPLIFWGYLVKNRFMAGELYALSWALVDWVASDPQVAEMKKGAEDKQTSKWMRLHPRADEVRWVSEHCWIYDHPRAGTVYSHGFLFPSEMKRVQAEVIKDIARAVPEEIAAQKVGSIPSPFGPNAPVPPAWSRSTVSKFGQRYSPPLPYLSQQTSIEALVEGSEMSQLTESTGVNPWAVWQRREGRNTRYNHQRVGGTIVVHFIKKNMWFLETAAAFLLGDDVTDAERGYHWHDGYYVGPIGAHRVEASATQTEQHPIQTNMRRLHRRR
ncbi:glycosyltransferase family 31 protein [Daedalea quercina L-15889]|uniref:Glycosyltransferase family 31 protein n=1 Tax=Daedalea quercina L-15889 TaxID=1314783 RepID=A0A165MEY4_9APHY|nr:glycosyltransferase family 31 protein [Daedalea quercina L-15889]